MPTFSWGHDSLQLTFDYDSDHPVRLAKVNFDGESWHLPLGPAVVEILTAEDGRNRSSTRLVYTELGSRLRYVEHRSSAGSEWIQLNVSLLDPVSGIRANLILDAHNGVAAVRARVSVLGSGARTILAVPSWSSSIFSKQGDLSGLCLLSGESDWLGEGRWRFTPLREVLPDFGLKFHGQDARGAFSASSKGSWSTGKALPVGALVDGAGRGVAWQVEHNGGWRWEIGEDLTTGYLSISGPTDVDHGWSAPLEAGKRFDSVPVSIAFGSVGANSIDQLTAFRRVSRRAHSDRQNAPVIYNDYMNTLMGDPTTEKLLPLIDAAADAGADVFCIDAGWYDDSTEWWDGVGEWVPSARRFPNGFAEVIERIRGRGMRPGLWMEPEVVGIRSAVASQLPESAFFTRNGRRVVEQGRFHLDLSDSHARAHLDKALDRLVDEFGIEYFKLDYNIDAGLGSDASGGPGAGLLAHNRGHLEWIDGILDRHENLVLENCSSGAMRMDFALLSRMQLQSTSDQQDVLLYPPIAASAPMSMLPEQAANWAYPQPGMSRPHAIFTLCTAMLGRFYLSGRLDAMTSDELSLVKEAVAAHKTLRVEIRESVPVWPLGLPEWDGAWIALGLTGEGHSSIVTLWKRNAPSATAQLSFPDHAGEEVIVEPIFPGKPADWEFNWNSEFGLLEITSASLSEDALTFRITPRRHREDTLKTPATDAAGFHQENKEQFQ